jgi:aryl-alcohol dehydrogenase-like predicted oxidoreductase
MLEQKQQDNEALLKELEELKALGATEHVKVSNMDANGCLFLNQYAIENISHVDIL